MGANPGGSWTVLVGPGETWSVLVGPGGPWSVLELRGLPGLRGLQRLPGLPGLELRGEREWASLFSSLTMVVWQVG